MRRKVNKKAIIVILIILLVGIFVKAYFIKNEKKPFKTVLVQRGTIIESVSATGQIKKGDKINLRFKKGGKIREIYVEEGEKVKRGEILASLDTDELEIQLKEAQAELKFAQSKLDKLLAGASKEQIELAETQVEKAKKSLKEAKENLQKTQELASQLLNNSYKNAQNIVQEAKLYTENAIRFINYLVRNYFSENDLVSVEVKLARNAINNELSQIENLYQNLSQNTDSDSVEAILSSVEDSLQIILDKLDLIREKMEEPLYRHIIIESDKVSLDTYRTSIFNSLSQLRTAIQNIESTKKNNELNITKAKTNVIIAEEALKEAQKNLSLITAKPRKEDVDALQSQIERAQARITLLEKEIEDGQLKSPVDGWIVEINKKVGEIVSSMDPQPVITVLPDNPFFVEVDIPEVDAAKVEVGNKVEIQVDALPNQIFQGEVSEMEIAGREIAGAVYYRTKIAIKNANTKIKPGMTAEVEIYTGKKDNVLILPLDAIIYKHGKKFVKVLKDGKIIEKEIQTGLISESGQVEIISGVSEGEKVIIGK